MLKSIILAAIAGFAFAGPAFAMEEIVRCNAKNKAKIMEMAERNPDEVMMKKAIKLLGMAGKMAAAGDIQGCREDLMKAMKAAESK